MADASDTSTTGDENDARLRKFRKEFRADADHSADWRKEAQEDYAFVAGEQWDAKDVQALKDASRPVITFNRVDPLIRAVVGEQIHNAQEVRYLPREIGAAKANDGLTSAARWFRDQCDADTEESDMFWDNAVCGMGWSDSRLDGSEDPDEPMPVVERVDPLEMFWDKDARKRNLKGSRRRWRVRDMPLGDAEAMFPDAAETDLDASWARDATDEGGRTKDAQDAPRYMEEGVSGDTDDDTMVTIVQRQWCEKQPFYKVQDPKTQQLVEMPAKEFEGGQLKARLDLLGVPYVKLSKEVYKQAFIGRIILKERDLGCPNFTLNCVTGFRDRNKGTWYGLVRAMKDPQRWANKWLSQTLHIMNANAKGGIMMEAGAVEDQREFEKTYAQTDALTWVADGSLSSANGPKFQKKPTAEFPQGFFQLMTFAISSVRDVAGINLEMLGMREADQAASLEMQRRQAGITILAQLFSSMKAYHRTQGRVLLYYIQNLLSPQTLVKIIGNDGSAQFQPLQTVLEMKATSAKYDIVVDEGPTSPNQKERIWNLIGGSERFLSLPKEIQLALLEYSPFPESVVEKLKQAAQQAAQGPEAQMAQKMQQLEAMLTEAKALFTQADTEKTKAETALIASEVGQPGASQMDGVRDVAPHVVRLHDIQTRAATDALKIQTGAQTELQKAQIAAGATNQRTASDAAVQRERTAADVTTNREWQATEIQKGLHHDTITAIGKMAQPTKKPGQV